MAQLDGFSKIIHNGKEVGEVLHQGKTVWSDVYLAKDSDFVKVGIHWVYRGAEKEVEIPTHINGVLVTSTQRMFSGSSDHQATPVTKVVLRHSNVNNMGWTFYEAKATTLDLSDFNTTNVTDMSNMFLLSKATTLNLSGFNTYKVTDMSHMLRETIAKTLDLSSFNTTNVKYTSYMFYLSKATIGYARTQTDANKFNTSSNKPTGLNFVVK